MYKLLKLGGAYKEVDGVRISFGFNDPDNTEYQAYLAWLAEGNEPLPADEGTQ
jgi:hypothetical protein